jgi:arginase family enzyme
VGGRSVAAHLPYPATADFINIPAKRSRSAIIARLAPLAGQSIFVSIDADVLDPSVAPNVPCPEPDGMSADDLLACCQWLGQHCNVIGADLSEIMPSNHSRNCELSLISCLLALKK